MTCKSSLALTWSKFRFVQKKMYFCIHLWLVEAEIFAAFSRIYLLFYLSFFILLIKNICLFSHTKQLLRDKYLSGYLYLYGYVVVTITGLYSTGGSPATNLLTIREILSSLHLLCEQLCLVGGSSWLLWTQRMN